MSLADKKLFVACKMPECEPVAVFENMQEVVFCIELCNRRKVYPPIRFEDMDIFVGEDCKEPAITIKPVTLVVRGQAYKYRIENSIFD